MNARFRAYGVEVFFEDDALREIARRSRERGQPAPAACSPPANGFSATSSSSCPAPGRGHLRSRPASFPSPAETLAGLLRAGHAEREKAQRAITAEFAERFPPSTAVAHHLRVRGGGSHHEPALEQNLGVREFCERAFKDYQFGLTLIKRNSGRAEFSLPARAVDDPDGVLSEWVVGSYRNPRDNFRCSPPALFFRLISRFASSSRPHQTPKVVHP